MGPPVGLVFWIQWVLATAVGFTVGAAGVAVAFRRVFPATDYVRQAAPGPSAWTWPWVSLRAELWSG